MTEERISWLDNAKAMGIALMVLGHMSIPDYVRQYIFSFHMPFFFFLSGYVFDLKKYPNFLGFLTKRLRSLIIPYFLFSFITYLYWVLIDNKMGASKGADIITPLWGIFYSNNRFANMSHNIALWFITCLFIVEIMFYEIADNVRSKALLYLLLVMSSVVGYLSSLYWRYPLPWSFEVVFAALPFYGVGYLLTVC